MRIESERLRLRPLAEDDAGDIYRHFNADITRYMFPAPAKSIADTQLFIANATQQLIDGDDLNLRISMRATGEFIGCCGLHGLAKRAAPELGIWIKQAAHGNGYGKEAINALMHWGQENLQCAAFIYPVDRRNTASRKIPEALGGEVVQECPKTSMSGIKLDILVYRIPVTA